LRVNSPSFSGRTVPLFDSILVHQGEGSGTPTEPHHTPSPKDRANIIKTSTLPYDSPPRVTSLAADKGMMSSHCQKTFPLLVKKVPPAEVIEFGDSYEAPQEVADTGSASEGSAKKKGRTVAVTTEDIQKRRNDTFGGNEATKKTKKNQLNQQYGNFKAEGSETLKQTFNRLQAIVSHLESDLDTMSLDDVYNHLKLYEPEVQKKLESNSQNMDFISSAKNSSRNGEVNTASISTASTQVSPASANVAATSISLDTACAYIASQCNGFQIKYEDINQIDEDDIEEMDIKDVAGFDKSNGECFNFHKMGHFARECMAPRSQDRGRRNNFKQGSKVEESAPKALMAIDGVGWDWSYIANKEEDHALVADQEALTEFALMAKFSSDNEVFDNSLCSKACKKNTDSINTKITELSEKLSDTKTTLYHYKLGLSQVEARLVEFKNQEIKFREKIRGLKFKVESKTNRIESLTNELKMLKKEKEGLDSKLTVLFPPSAQFYSPPKRDMSWTGLPEFADDTITDYSRLSPNIESDSSDLQNNDSSVSDNGESSESIMSKPMIKFVKVADSPKSSNVRGNQRNWNNLKSQQLEENFLMKNKACFKCGHFDHLAYDCDVWVDQRKTWPKNNNTHKSMSPRNVFHKTDKTPTAVNRSHMNVAQSKRTYFSKSAHSYVSRPVQRKSAVRTQFRVLRVSAGNTKFPTVNKNFPTGNSKLSTANLGNKGKAEDARLLEEPKKISDALKDPSWVEAMQEELLQFKI
nr:ribonuclease H-like domain-containing protein [Tanacetum cinerariifolium]